MGFKSRILGIIIAGVTVASSVLSLSSTPKVSATAEPPLTSYPTGCKGYSSEGFLYLEEEADYSGIQARSSLSSFDIPSHGNYGKYFPEIGDQGDMLSCVAFATTYYQFTYEVNKLRGIETTPSNTYSPTWTYNYLNLGINQGTYVDQAYNILYTQGALTMADMPYNGSLQQYSFEWSSDVPKMLNALKYRAKSESIHYDESNINVSLVRLKQAISSGKVLTMRSRSDGWDCATNSDGEMFIVRTHENNSGHAIAVVGYDDNKQVTVNGVTLTGALKIANSWGDTWGNDGYIWLCYDSLNETSLYGTDWQSIYSTERISSSTDDIFRTLTPFVSKCEICEVVQFSSLYPWGMQVFGDKGTTATSKKAGFITSAKFASNGKNRYLVFDYHDFGGSYILNGILTSQWTVRLKGYSANSVLTRLVDNLNQDINPSNPNEYEYFTMTNGTYTKTHSISLAIGRISSYDNNPINQNDINLLQQYLLGNTSFSSLQSKLADYNQDGKVDGFDLTALRQQVASSNGQNLSFNEIENEIMVCVSGELDSDETFDEFMAGELAIDNIAA